VHLQTWGADVETAIAHGLALGAIDPARVLVKVPLTREGAETARQLIAAGLSVTFTACYEAHQVLIAAALGARYVAPYLGRISDAGRDGHAELRAMQQCLEALGSTTRLLVASLRQPQDLSQLAVAGVGTFTLSPELATALFASAATSAAAAQFERDALGLPTAEHG
jgi:transaldolase